MPNVKADLITHPIRARILTTLIGRQLTTQQIAQLLPEVPLPSLYRHIRALTEGQILDAVEEVRVNGALTKVYAVRKGEAQIGQKEVADATLADHFRYFTTFLNTLSETFRASLERGSGDPKMVQSLMGSLHLTPDEYREFCDALAAFLKPWQENAPGGERRRLLFAHILYPDLPDPPLS